jgi:ubiquinol-cytochrome c reductase cytochrome b subunit
MGTPGYGIETPAATRIIQDIAPQEGVGPLRAVPFDQLQEGVYEVGITEPVKLCPNIDFGCPEFEAVFGDYSQRVQEAADRGDLPDYEAVMLVENWQQDLKKVTMRIVWSDADQRKTYEQHVYIHKDRIND